ncbi:hypothetical protein Tco_0046572 [Tanacetum coccineum]
MLSGLTVGRSGLVTSYQHYKLLALVDNNKDFVVWATSKDKGAAIHDYSIWFPESREPILFALLSLTLSVIHGAEQSQMFIACTIELKELKDQFRSCVERGFIRASVCKWGYCRFCLTRSRTFHRIARSQCYGSLGILVNRGSWAALPDVYRFTTDEVICQVFKLRMRFAKFSIVFIVEDCTDSSEVRFKTLEAIVTIIDALEWAGTWDDNLVDVAPDSIRRLDRHEGVTDRARRALEFQRGEWNMFLESLTTRGVRRFCYARAASSFCILGRLRFLFACGYTYLLFKLFISFRSSLEDLHPGDSAWSQFRVRTSDHYDFAA